MSSADDLLADIASLEANPPPVKRLTPPPQELSAMDKLLAKVPTALVNNPAVAGVRNLTTLAAAPMVGGAQAIANVFPDSTGVPQLYNRKVGEMLRANKEASHEAGPVASAANELVGSMISPANLALALRAGPAVNAAERAWQGGTIGAVAGATTPVEVNEPKSSDLVTDKNLDAGKFWPQKAWQTGAGAGGGAILAPVMGAIGDKVMARINAKNVTPASAVKEADNIITSALKESNQRMEDLPDGQLDNLRKQVTNALAQGKRLDAAAAMRLKDFQAEGIKPLQGWVTRDPMQWAEEQNVRGVKGAGEAVGRAIAEGNRGVMSAIGGYSSGAKESSEASQGLAAALRGYDQTQREGVTKAYAAARASTDKDLDIPLQGLSQDAARIFKDFGNRSELGGIRSALADYGVFGGKQIKVFNFEEADRLLKLINKSGSTEPAVQAALGELRTAVKSAITSVDARGGPYAPAVKAAAERFRLHDEVPAIAKAISGEVDDRFVSQNIIANPSTPEVKRLAAFLRKEAPESFEQARQQIGAHLSEKAFGANAPGDKGVNQESYNRALKALGTGKLEAFFAPDEVDQLKRLGRLASYQVAPPAGSAANYSNTASTVANLLRSMGGYLPVAKGSVQFVGDKIAAGAAVKPEVPVTPNLSDAQRKALSRALLAISGGGATVVPRVIGEQP